MDAPRDAPNRDQQNIETPQAKLERMYLAEYLRGKACTPESMADLPLEKVKQLMVEASTYASTRLAEEEQRAKIVGEVHGSAYSTRKRRSGARRGG